MRKQSKIVGISLGLLVFSGLVGSMLFLPTQARAEKVGGTRATIIPRLGGTWGVDRTLILPVQDGSYRVRLNVRRGQHVRNTTARVKIGYDNRFWPPLSAPNCPNRHCVPLVWALDGDYIDQAQIEFSFMSAGVTARTARMR